MSNAKKRKRGNSGALSTVLLVVVALIGIGLLLYPTVSDWWNSMHQSYAVASYVEQVTELDDHSKEEMLEAAVAYNRTLMPNTTNFNLTEEQIAEYNSLLDPSGNGIMAYIEIPKINVQLPIYHGTDEAVLQIAIGHIPGSSLPVGGVGTHAVFSGHRGLPSAKLFTNLDQLLVGDTFLIRTMDQIMTYEVDQVLIVLPNQTEALAIDPEMDYCTLVTCTPYGVNTHRLLVRGHRIENQEEAEVLLVTADAIQIDPVIMTPIVAAPILVVMIAVVLINSHRRKQKKKKQSHEQREE